MRLHAWLTLLRRAGGGYIFGSDHSVPNSVSLETFRRTVELAKQLGSYEN